MELNAKEYKPDEVLRFIRQNSGLTQKEFAKKIGKSEFWEQSNEIGRANYYFKDLIKIAKLFNLDIIIRDRKN